MPSELKKIKIITIRKARKVTRPPLELYTYFPCSAAPTNIWYFGQVPIEQAGSRTDKSCFDQAPAPTTFIETGVQKMHKIAVVFVHVTAAYEPVWIESLIYEFLKIIWCRTTTAVKTLKTADFALAFRANELGQTETCLWEDLASLNSYFEKWSLKSIDSKTKVL